MDADELVLWVVGGALVLIGLGILALLGIWVPHVINILLRRDDEE